MKEVYVVGLDAGIVEVYSIVGGGVGPYCLDPVSEPLNHVYRTPSFLVLAEAKMALVGCSLVVMFCKMGVCVRPGHCASRSECLANRSPQAQTDE